MHHVVRGRVVAVLTTAVVLVGGLNVVAYAANGKPLLLGGGNTASKSTKLTNTGRGPALTVKTRASAPPFAVTSRRKVARLNADAVDGLGAEAMVNQAYTFAVPASSASAASFRIALPGLPPGTYLASYSIVTSGGRAGCYLRSTSGGRQGLAYGSEYSGYGTTNATAFLDASSGDAEVACFSMGAPFRLYNLVGDAESSVTLTAVSSATRLAGAPDPAREPAGRGATGTGG